MENIERVEHSLKKFVRNDDHLCDLIDNVMYFFSQFMENSVKSKSRQLYSKVESAWLKFLDEYNSQNPVKTQLQDSIDDSLNFLKPFLSNNAIPFRNGEKYIEVVQRCQKLLKILQQAINKETECDFQDMIFALKQSLNNDIIVLSKANISSDKIESYIQLFKDSLNSTYYFTRKIIDKPPPIQEFEIAIGMAEPKETKEDYYDINETSEWDHVTFGIIPTNEMRYQIKKAADALSHTKNKDIGRFLTRLSTAQISEENEVVRLRETIRLMNVAMTKPQDLNIQKLKALPREDLENLLITVISTEKIPSPKQVAENAIPYRKENSSPKGLFDDSTSDPIYKNRKNDKFLPPRFSPSPSRSERNKSNIPIPARQKQTPSPVPQWSVREESKNKQSGLAKGNTTPQRQRRERLSSNILPDHVNEKLISRARPGQVVRNKNAKTKRSRTPDPYAHLKSSYAQSSIRKKDSDMFSLYRMR